MHLGNLLDDGIQVAEHLAGEIAKNRDALGGKQILSFPIGLKRRFRAVVLKAVHLDGNPRARDPDVGSESTTGDEPLRLVLDRFVWQPTAERVVQDALWIALVLFLPSGTAGSRGDDPQPLCLFETKPHWHRTALSARRACARPRRSVRRRPSPVLLCRLRVLVRGDGGVLGLSRRVRRLTLARCLDRGVL
jgi:hypothetical protein